MSLENKIGAGVNSDIQSIKKGVNFGLASLTTIAKDVIVGTWMGASVNLLPYVFPYLLNDFDKFNTKKNISEQYLIDGSNQIRDYKSFRTEINKLKNIETEKTAPIQGSFQYYLDEYEDNPMRELTPLLTSLVTAGHIGIEHLKFYANQIQQENYWTLLIPVATTVASYIHCKYIQEKRRS